MKFFRSILILKFGGVGDVVTSTPALRALRQSYPKAKIYLMVESPGLEVVKGSPWIDELITYTKLYRAQNFLKLLTSPSRLKEGWQLFKFLLSHRFDIFIELHQLFDLRDTIKPIIIGYLSRAPVKIGLDTDGRGFFLTIKIPDKRFVPEHMVSRCLRLVKKLGAETDDPQTAVWITEKDRQYAAKLLKLHSPFPLPSGERIGAGKDAPIIGLHPTGNTDYLIRTSWPEERFAEVADTLANKYHARIVITGSSCEIPYIRKVVSLMKCQPVVIAGKTSIKQLAAVIERCDLFISSDTGPMHIAVAMKVPTIGIFGPGDWQMYGTYPAESKFIMLKKHIDCTPCRNLKCTSRKCFNLITVEDVLAGADKFLPPYSSSA